MFSGIVETAAKVTFVESEPHLLRIKIERPNFFNDIARGHSISVNGVCLTLEDFDENEMAFTVGAETIKITNWNTNLKVGEIVNLERPLKLGDRIHGHIVTGHVDEMAQVLEMQEQGEICILKVSHSLVSRLLVWKKGSICINGVSLTVNESQQTVQVCLIPETLKRTNLKKLKVGDFVTIEFDYMAKAMQNLDQKKRQEEDHSEFHL